MKTKVNRWRHALWMAGVVLAMCGCEKSLLTDDVELPTQYEENGPATARLHVISRASGNPDNATLKEGRVYVFNSAGSCVELLTTDEDNNQATALLPPGRYTLCAVGSDDLSRFALPAQQTATAASVITRQDGKVMGDLLQAVAEVVLEDEETVNQNLALEHKVLCMDEITMKQLPDDVTKVEVTFSPLYGSVQLNGTYPDGATESYKIALQKQDDGTTWKAEPRQMLFPSKGNPTIKVAVTTEAGTKSYAYNATEELPANHHFTVEGTYKQSGVSLTGILTASGWGEDRTVSFDFSDDVIVYDPVAQTRCNGYYVVSVNAAERTAVLLAQRSISFTQPADGSTNADWKAALTAPMAGLDLPTGITTGAWRLPTLDEAAVITGDGNLITYGTNGNSPSYFAVDDSGLLYFAYTKKDGDTYTFKKGSTTFNEYVWLRPVIDINY